MPIVGTTVEASMWRLRDKIPDGTIVGARGPNGPFAPDTAAQYLVPQGLHGPLRHPADLSVLPDGARRARPEGSPGRRRRRRRAARGRRPKRSSRLSKASNTTRPNGHVKLAIGNGHQGVQETAYGTYKLQQADEDAGIRRRRAISRRMREPAGRCHRRRLDQGRHEGRQMQLGL